MAKCALSGKKRMRANRVSHSNIKSKHHLNPNVQRKRIFDVETGLWVRLSLSTRAIRTLNKLTLAQAAKL